MLARREEAGQAIEDIHAFFNRSLGGVHLAEQSLPALTWLSAPNRALAYQDPLTGRFSLTVLGVKATRAMMPLPIAAGFAQLLRDLITLDPDDSLLSQWGPIDHLLVLSLFPSRTSSVSSLRAYSGALVEGIDAWIERRLVDAGGSVIFRKWISGSPLTSRIREVLGSLGLFSGGSAGKEAHKTAYLALLRTILLFERSQGVGNEDVERTWGIRNLEGVEDSWRDETLWLLSGLSDLLDVRCFYFHLRETCQADYDRVTRVKRRLHLMRQQVLNLRNDIAYCSPPGPLLRDLRDTIGVANAGTVGIGSIRRLESAGITTALQLRQLSVEDLIERGIRPKFARQIATFLRRRAS